jgi:hypothetical protein
LSSLPVTNELMRKSKKTVSKHTTPILQHRCILAGVVGITCY